MMPTHADWRIEIWDDEICREVKKVKLKYHNPQKLKYMGTLFAKTFEWALPLNMRYKWQRKSTGVHGYPYQYERDFVSCKVMITPDWWA